MSYFLLLCGGGDGGWRRRLAVAGLRRGLVWRAFSVLSRPHRPSRFRSVGRPSRGNYGEKKQGRRHPRSFQSAPALGRARRSWCRGEASQRCCSGWCPSLDKKDAGRGADRWRRGGTTRPTAGAIGGTHAGSGARSFELAVTPPVPLKGSSAKIKVYLKLWFGSGNCTEPQERPVIVRHKERAPRGHSRAPRSSPPKIAAEQPDT